MSGGSYNYAYSHVLEDVGRHASNLRSMADRCRRVATEADPGAPPTTEQRVWALLRALRLDLAATALEKASSLIAPLREVMRDVEWVESGDYGTSSLCKPFKDDESPQ